MGLLSTTSCCDDNNFGKDNGINSILPIILLLCLCGGDNGFLGGSFGNDKCDNNNGFEGILPLILILCLCGGSF